jgi:hypothetical protein
MRREKPDAVTTPPADQEDAGDDARDDVADDVYDEERARFERLKELNPDDFE